MLNAKARTEKYASLTNADTADIIEELVKDNQELLTLLGQAGTITEGEDGTSLFTANTVESNDDYKTKYELLQKKYVERFVEGVQHEVDDAKDDITDANENIENAEQENVGITGLFEKEDK
jgi:hypothetical protein